MMSTRSLDENYEDVKNTASLAVAALIKFIFI